MASVEEATVEEFLLASGVDEVVAQMLRDAPFEVQKAVLDRGGFEGARNPSAVLRGRINTAMGGCKGGGQGGATTKEVEAFILEHELDERAGEALRGAPSWVQQGVITAGGMDTARNRSAAVIGRLREVQSYRSGGSCAKGGWDAGWDAGWGKGGNGGWGKGPGGFDMGLPYGYGMWDVWGCGSKGGKDPWGMTGKDPWGNWSGKDPWGGWGSTAEPTPVLKNRPVHLGSGGKCHFLTIDSSCSLVAGGMPMEAPAVEYEKSVPVFGSANWILDAAIPDNKESCTFEHDGEWTVYPAIGAAWQAAGHDDCSYTVAACPTLNKWAIGVSPGYKNAEKAAKIALAVAVVNGTPKMASLAKNYPEWSNFCKSAGLISGALPAAQPTPAPVAESSWAPPCPDVLTLSVPSTSRITKEGLPAEGLAILWQKDFNKFFNNAEKILTETVPNTAQEVSIIHDPDWKEFPELGPIVKEAIGESMCYAVGTCASAAKWAVGISQNWKGREGSVRLALAVACLGSDVETIKKLASEFPEFGKLATKNGFVNGGPPAKRAKLA